MRALLGIVALLPLVFGCKRKESPRFDGPMPVELGDCAGASVTWVSGPKPVPLVAAPSDAPPPTTALDGSTLGTKPTGDDEASRKAARQQAIEQARAAGILGGGGAIDTVPGFESLTGTPTGDSAARSRPPNLPTVAIGQPSAQGDLDKAIIRRYIKRNIQRIQTCYEKQLLKKPTLSGTTSVQFFITSEGTVQTATGTGMDPEVATCVADVIKAIEFPKPKGGGGVQVSYPFTFRPIAGSVPTAVPAPDVAPTTPPTPPVPPATAIAAPAAPVAVADRRPPSQNPLRAAARALSECFRRNPVPYGAVVVELAYDPAGNVTSATPHGLDDPDTTACVVAAAKQTVRGDPGPSALRCSLAFGTKPVTAMSAIDIDAKGISLDGKALAPVNDPAGGEMSWTPVPEVVAAVQSRTAPGDAVITTRDPFMLRPVDSTPMKEVERVWSSVIAGGGDFLFAARRGATWSELSSVKLPAVPVPAGTGGTWNRLKHRAHLVGGLHDEHVVLSVLLQADQVWVGLSRVNEFQQLVAGPDQADKLLATLKDHKSSAFFQGQTDLEIAADDTVPYGAVVSAIDIATKAGFTSWVLTTPSELAAVPTL